MSERNLASYERSNQTLLDYLIETGQIEHHKKKSDLLQVVMILLIGMGLGIFWWEVLIRRVLY